MDSFNNFDAGSLAGFDVVIIGGGISGITTAITTQSLGLSTAIVSSAKPMQKACDKQNAHVPTEFAMASAYPHNLLISNLKRISLHSQQVFGALLNQPGSGIAKYKMFELFENAPT
ncbi:MAG: FAD-binding protein, partial [Candidatus Obscuribacterales bacterium]|nr:FAD-binding protein [Candidatus Obscuribacterales bacterium]